MPLFCTNRAQCRNKSLQQALPQRNGFVLLMALVLIVIAAISLAGFARRSLSLAGQVAAEQKALERRWGRVTCEKVLLLRAQELLGKNDLFQQALHEENDPNGSDEPLGWPFASQLEGQFRLGSHQYTVLLSDEGAKVNLNTLEQQQVGAAQRYLSAFLREGGKVDLSVRFDRPPARKESQPRYSSWGEVFDLSEDDLGQQLPDRLQMATLEATCWGRGKLNIRRASDQAIRAICQKGVSSKTLRKFLEYRREPGGTDWTRLIARTAPSIRERAALRRLLAEQSRCYSMWISIENHQRKRTFLMIDQPQMGTNQLRFSW